MKVENKVELLHATQYGGLDTFVNEGWTRTIDAQLAKGGEVSGQ